MHSSFFWLSVGGRTLMVKVACINISEAWKFILKLMKDVSVNLQRNFEIELNTKIQSYANKYIHAYRVINFEVSKINKNYFNYYN